MNCELDPEDFNVLVTEALAWVYLDSQNDFDYQRSLQKTPAKSV